MNRLDYYEILPAGLEAYLSSHGRHFSKPMLEWAVSMMRNRKNERQEVPKKEWLDNVLNSFNVKLERNEGYYDVIYVWCMAKSDYLGSSIKDDQHLALYVKDYIDDIDGNPTRAFDEFMANCIAKGIDVPWEDMI